MARTIESIVECHRAARERIEQGRPVWDRKIPIRGIILRNQEDRSNEHAAGVGNEISDLVRSRVPASWLDITKEDYDSDLDEIIEYLGSLSAADYADDPSYSAVDELNSLLDRLYDWADRNRIWLGG